MGIIDGKVFLQRADDLDSVAGASVDRFEVEFLVEVEDLNTRPRPKPSTSGG